MLHFTRLRLSGFKSFVDSAELLIEPGMTGVVGPNGCGKSNLIEALRWVMGETSARQMRGGEMDDVIFGGTANRPARNLAEVGVVLDNAGREAPPQYAADELQVMRRIDRGQGSHYRINGQEVRARDVQLLFADASTGARSSGLISQGRVGALISARPAERRVLLEEAAGISGLYSRRHEAELRLKGAEGNLERLDDILVTLDEQLQGLRKQARQAARYRTLSEQIRVTEARLLYRQWIEALAVIDAARAAFRQAEQEVETRTLAAAAAATRQAEAAAVLPGLRREDAEAQGILQRLLVEREHLEGEESRLLEARRALETRLSQASGDVARERARTDDAEEALARLGTERETLTEAAADEADATQAAETKLNQAASATAALESALSQVMAEVAAADAERATALRRLQETETRRDRLRDRLGQVLGQKTQVEAESIDRSDLTAAEMDLEAAAEYLEESRLSAETWEQDRLQAQTARDQAREAHQQALNAGVRLKAEAEALTNLLAQQSGGDYPPILDRVTATVGYEAALAAALGEDLLAALTPEAPLHWVALPPLEPAQSLPTGVESLLKFVTAPSALGRRLAQTGVAPDPAEARRLRPHLAAGQQLVSREGDLVRWDGYTVLAGAPNPMALRLAQRNRLRELEATLEDLQLGVESAAEEAETATLHLESAIQNERSAREAVKRAEKETTTAREAHAVLAQRFTAFASRLSALEEQVETARADLEEAEAEVLLARETVDAFPASAEDGRDKVNGLRADLAVSRSGLVEARAALDRLIREAGDRKRRLNAIAADEDSWRQRVEAARMRVEELEERREAVAMELERLAEAPTHFALRRAALLDKITLAEADRKRCGDTLIVAEDALVKADQAARAAEAGVGTARENLIRHEAAVGAADQNCRAIAGRIAERLDMPVEQLRGLISAEEQQDGASLEDLQRRLDRLSRERDAMGPVNLRAEQEVTDLETRLASLRHEKDDLVQAIAKLRSAIGELNREGRERLLAAFEQVDRHFRELFVRLFGGGRAHLTLTESDDPLEAGLEIMASPPGKRLQQLSLLSGGEQALTALALIFAVFVITPAPICVLDEVDAPLDDANVDRFCTLVEDIAHMTGTRFLIVTHHRMTMARMDRLYGVTMAERGVSQLVSVDLARAAQMVEA